MIPVEIDPEHRRSAMLARLLRALCVLVGISAVALMVNPPSFQPRWAYAAMTTSMFGVLALAYGLNRAGRYRPAAWLTILVACAGPWGSVLIDPSILAGDVVPLSFAVVPILLSALLLSPLGTVLVGALQLALLTVVLTLSPELDSVNWPSLLSLVVFVSILSVVVNQTTLADWAQIDRQTQQLSGYAATLREQTVRDPLTGLFNRRYLEETLERELARARRAGTTIGVIMVDVDRFKPFNDTHGHLAGDALLRSIGALLQGQVRASDVACRYGGDEFTLVLPDASREATGMRAVRMLDATERMLEAVQASPGGVGLSFGIAIFPEHGTTGAALIQAADAALYAAKRTGRGRIAFANTVPDKA